MKQEYKELLLKDICARIPYNTRIDGGVEGYIILDAIWYGIIAANIEMGLEPYLPYLRPMSSMTEEEQEEFVKFHCVNICPIILTDMLTLDNESKMFDWLNEHHFDYRGLIPKGLALETHEGMYNIK